MDAQRKLDTKPRQKRWRPCPCKGMPSPGSCHLGSYSGPPRFFKTACLPSGRHRGTMACCRHPQCPRPAP
ncbi:hypothetical protein B0H19DRAFT_1137202 [Mycena capillaripes]|nr:hypothetical protein B0H19DRAFT_1204639 [Mycena capillaripes]KAJ6566215.1 hypothetical protein B0H19DRAFT_1137202 [Mycena capillaripes]